MAIKQSSYVFFFLSLFFVACAGFSAHDTPKKQLITRQCQEHCERVQQEEQLLASCLMQCQSMFGQDKEKLGGENYKKNNPYVFNEEDFITLVKTELGRDTILPKFSARSEKLRGVVENLRIRVVEASPLTFGPPIHADAHSLMVVVKGQGSIHMVTNKKRSFNVVLGDIFMVPSGVTSYMVNRGDEENLILLNLIVPIAVTGHFETFARLGSNEPESLYSAFSWEVLEAAFKTYREKFEKIFDRTERGFIKATREQIDALTPTGEGADQLMSQYTFNLPHKRATFSNEFGSLIEADGHDYKPLQDLNVIVSFANITKGAMIAPYYNSRVATIAFVMEGEGRMEMGGWHHEGARIETDDCKKIDDCERSFGRVSAWLRQGTVFVVPAGYPVVVVASENETTSQNLNLKILSFEVNAKDNIRVPLAGKDNLVCLMDKEARELTFNVPVSDVDSVFCKQEEELFLPGPKKEHYSEKEHWAT